MLHPLPPFDTDGCLVHELSNWLDGARINRLTKFDLERLVAVALWGEEIKEGEVALMRVTASECKSLMKRFGPESNIILSKIIDNLVDPGLFAHPWFHGRISRQEAEACLREYPLGAGSYLLRFSDSTPGTFALSRSYEHMGEVHVRHYLVYNLGASGYGLKAAAELCSPSEIFQSIPEFISREPLVFRHPVHRNGSIFVGLSQPPKAPLENHEHTNLTGVSNYEGGDDWIAGYGAIDDGLAPAEWSSPASQAVLCNDSACLNEDTAQGLEMSGYGCFIDGVANISDMAPDLNGNTEPQPPTEVDMRAWKLHSLLSALAKAGSYENRQDLHGAYSPHGVFCQYDVAEDSFKESDKRLADIRILICLSEIRQLLGGPRNHLSETLESAHEAFDVMQCLVTALFIWISANRAIPTNTFDSIFLDSIGSLSDLSKNPNKSHELVSISMKHVMDLLEKTPIFISAKSDVSLDTAYFILPLCEYLENTVPAVSDSCTFISEAVLAHVQVEVAGLLIGFADLLEKFLPGHSRVSIIEKAVRVYLSLVARIELVDDWSVDKYIISAIQVPSKSSDKADIPALNKGSVDLKADTISPLCVASLEKLLSFEIDAYVRMACCDKLRYLELVYMSPSSERSIDSHSKLCTSKSLSMHDSCGSKPLLSVYTEELVLDDVRCDAKVYLRQGQAHLENVSEPEHLSKGNSAESTVPNRTQSLSSPTAYTAFRRSLFLARRVGDLEDEIAGLANLSAILGSNGVVDVFHDDRHNTAPTKIHSHGYSGSELDRAMGRGRQLLECTYFLRQFIILSSRVGHGRDLHTIKAGDMKTSETISAAPNLILQGAYFLCKCYISLGWKIRAEQIVQAAMTASCQVSNKAKFQHLLSQLSK